jgi:hypothetical protein
MNAYPRFSFRTVSTNSLGSSVNGAISSGTFKQHLERLEIVIHGLGGPKASRKAKTSCFVISPMGSSARLPRNCKNLFKLSRQKVMVDEVVSARSAVSQSFRCLRKMARLARSPETSSRSRSKTSWICLIVRPAGRWNSSAIPPTHGGCLAVMGQN